MRLNRRIDKFLAIFRISRCTRCCWRLYSWNDFGRGRGVIGEANGYCHHCADIVFKAWVQGRNAA